MVQNTIIFQRPKNGSENDENMVVVNIVLMIFVFGMLEVSVSQSVNPQSVHFKSSITDESCKALINSRYFLFINSNDSDSFLDLPYLKRINSL